LITKEQINLYIEKIPPTPKVLRETLLLLNSGELVQASKIAQTDKALNAYLVNLVNKPIYGFRNKVHNISQIFAILGVAGSQKVVYNYMISLLSPKHWILFKLNINSFHNLQAELSTNWDKILKHLNINDKDIQSAISLLPASIIVSEALFKDNIEDVALLRSVNHIDLNTILKRLCDMDLFDICEQISVKWEMPIQIAEIVQGASGVKEIQDDKIRLLSKWMHLLLFFTLSKPIYIEAGLNDFIDFNVDYVSDIYEDFIALMDIS